MQTDYDKLFKPYNGKTAKFFQDEYKKENSVSGKLRMRIRWVILNSNKIPYKDYRFAWVAIRLLNITPNTLSRKLSGERTFTSFELLALKDYFGEDMLDVINYDIDENGKLVRIEGEE